MLEKNLVSFCMLLLLYRPCRSFQCSESGEGVRPGLETAIPSCIQPVQTCSEQRPRTTDCYVQRNFSGQFSLSDKVISERKDCTKVTFSSNLPSAHESKRPICFIASQNWTTLKITRLTLSLTDGTSHSKAMLERLLLRNCSNVHSISASIWFHASEDRYTVDRKSTLPLPCNMYWVWLSMLWKMM